VDVTLQQAGPEAQLLTGWCGYSSWCSMKDVQDDMADLMEDMNEIQELMGRSYGCVLLVV
jgi:hypothetical protein